MSGDGDPYTPGTIVWEQGSITIQRTLTSGGYWAAWSTNLKNEKLKGGGWYQIILIGGGQRCYQYGSTFFGGGGGQAVVANIYIRDTDTVTITAFGPLTYLAPNGALDAQATMYINAFGNSRYPAVNLKLHLSSMSNTGQYDLCAAGGGNFCSADNTGTAYFLGQQSAYYIPRNVDGGNYSNMIYYGDLVGRIDGYYSYAGSSGGTATKPKKGSDSTPIGYNGFQNSNISLYSSLYTYGKGEGVLVSSSGTTSNPTANTGGYFRLTYIGQTI